MTYFSNILVVLPDNNLADIVLFKAMRLARSSHARITVMAEKKQQTQLNDEILRQYCSSAISAPLYKGDESEHIDYREKYFTLPITHKQVLAEIACNDYDLVMKNINAASTFLGISWSDNAYLLREKNTHLLLVGEQNWQSNSHILTALETEDSSDNHQRVNQFILDESQYLAKLLHGDVHLINCCQEQPSVSLATPVHARNNLEPLDKHRSHLSESGLNYGVSHEYVHVEQGLPEYIIPNEAVKYNADVVVLGAGEHHGLLSQISGHTSEYVVNQLQCDALILKANTNKLH